MGIYKILYYIYIYHRYFVCIAFAKHCCPLFYDLKKLSGRNPVHQILCEVREEYTHF